MKRLSVFLLLATAGFAVLTLLTGQGESSPPPSAVAREVSSSDGSNAPASATPASIDSNSHPNAPRSPGFHENEPTPLMAPAGVKPDLDSRPIGEGNSTHSAAHTNSDRPTPTPIPEFDFAPSYPQVTDLDLPVEETETEGPVSLEALTAGQLSDTAAANGDTDLVLPTEEESPTLAALKLDPKDPWPANSQDLRDHFRTFRQQAPHGGHNSDWWTAHESLRAAYEASLDPATLAALPGRGTPSQELDQTGWTLNWYVAHADAHYETVIRPTGAAQDLRTPVEVVTYNRSNGREEARYQANAFLDSDGTIEIDATGQRVESEVWHGNWSPDSFSLQADGELRSVDDKFDGCSGAWSPAGDS